MRALWIIGGMVVVILLAVGLWNFTEFLFRRAADHPAPKIEEEDDG